MSVVNAKMTLLLHVACCVTYYHVNIISPNGLLIILSSHAFYLYLILVELWPASRDSNDVFLILQVLLQ